MVQKRSFDAEETLGVSFKRPKQVGPGNQLVSFSESFFPEDACRVPKSSEGGCRAGSSYQKLAGDTFVGLPRGAGNYETSFPGGISVSSWATGDSSEDDVPSEPPLHLPFFPEYFSPERPVRTLVHYEDIYSLLLEHPPHNHVSVGANHQADVPSWDSPCVTGGPNTSADAVSDSDFTVRDEVGERLMGTCIFPMPRMELSSYDDEVVGEGRADCSCEDTGSMRCVRQHIVEAREKLMKTIEHERFANLGLSEMGEQVAEKWDAEDEQLFHEVVFNNPASLGKNFWNYLPIVFPSRTKKEIVSYYFNVFMLRRRAEQNRNDLLNVDSDDDEWQSSHGEDIATLEEDEDSIVESPVYQDYTSPTDCHENDLKDYDEYASDETCAVNGIDRNIDDDSKYDPAEMPYYMGSPPLIQPEDQPVWPERCDEVQHDSCTSSDAGVASQETMVKIENDDHWCGDYEVCNGYSQGYVLGPCDAEVWDSGSSSRNEIDFLPTCNIIEEIFGDGRRQDLR